MLPAKAYDFFYIRNRIRRIQLHVIGHFAEIVPPGNGVHVQSRVRPNEAPTCVLVCLHGHRLVFPVAFGLLLRQIFPYVREVSKLLPAAPEGKEAVRVILRLRGSQQERKLIQRRPHIVGNDIGLHQVTVFAVHKQELVVHIQIDGFQVVKSGRLPQKVVGCIVILGRRTQIVCCPSGQFFVEFRVVGPVAMGASQEQGIDLLACVGALIELMHS